jgi:catechol 2,3-dioxygenase-like lactoylglutathione lyase family enzyme
MQWRTAVQPMVSALGSGMRIRSIDHLVLVVRSVEEAIRFYSLILGMRVETMPNGRKALHFGNQKVNLQQYGGDTDQMNRHPTPGSADFCLLMDTPIEVAIAELRLAGVSLADGPVIRNGASGPIRSIYIYDPDDNLVELSNLLPPTSRSPED